MHLSFRRCEPSSVLREQGNNIRKTTSLRNLQCGSAPVLENVRFPHTEATSSVLSRSNNAAATVFILVIDGLHIGVHGDQSLHHGDMATHGSHVEKCIVSARKMSTTTSNKSKASSVPRAQASCSEIEMQ
jgi:hypothetical protein